MKKKIINKSRLYLCANLNSTCHVAHVTLIVRTYIGKGLPDVGFFVYLKKNKTK